jgi:hypothetical protein
MNAMTVSSLIEQASAAGIRLVPDGDTLRLRTRRDPPAELVEALRAHKPEILAALRQQPALAECLSRLQAMPYPADIEVDRWALFLADAAAFLAVWGPQAERTGWRASDLFAVPGGLCWALDGREVVALSITPSEATIRAKDAGAGPGATVAFHRPAALLALPWGSQP